MIVLGARNVIAWGRYSSIVACGEVITRLHIYGVSHTIAWELHQKTVM